MIETLRVHNLAVIEELELELGPGLTVLTGETGAGKSVLLSAVALLCGRRVSSEVIRSGEAEARVEAIVSGPRPLALAHSLGLVDEGAEELLVVRTLSREGRGRVFVNGALATAALLAELLGDEIEVTSQGEHQRLLRAEVQTELLDAFADLGPRASEVAALHQRWWSVARELHERRTRREQRARREDQLRFELEQIERAEPSAGELEELAAEHRRLAHVDRLVQSSSTALEGLEGEGGAEQALAAARRQLRDALELDAELAEADAGLARAELELEEAARSLERYRSGLEADPARLERVESRLAELRRLQSRYGATLEEVLAYRDRARRELEDIGGGEAREAELERELEACAESLRSAALDLQKARRHAGEELAAAVHKELRALELGRARFEVAHERLPAKTSEGWSAPSGPGGLERAVFTLGANPGEEPRRLRDAASGGELARLLLALRNVLRGADEGSLLLFDEIDAGIGGRTARRVGERLRRLGRRHQILCITHLAPIAALGREHYRVDKRVRGGRTRTVVLRIDGPERVDEIARLTSGGSVTEAARAHARELLGAHS